VRLPPPGDQEEFYERLQLYTRTDPERAVVCLLWRTGMHSSTLVGGDFRLVCNLVEWTRPKTGKRLSAAIPIADANLLERVIAAGLFPNTTRTLGRWVQRVGERAGYSQVCPLTLRHSRAIWLLDQKLPVNRVASLLGCSYAVLEKHYAQIEAARLL